MNPVTVIFLVISTLTPNNQAEPIFPGCISRIAERCFQHGIVSIFSAETTQQIQTRGFFNKTYDDSLIMILRNLMQSSQWSFKLYSDQAKIMKPYEQMKHPPHEAFIIFFAAPGSFTKILKIIKTMRILGPDSKVLVVIKGEDVAKVDELLLLVLQNLRVVNIFFVIAHEDNVQVYNPLSNQFTACMKKIECTHLKERIGNPSINDHFLSIFFERPIKMIVPPDSEPFVFDEHSGGDGLCVRSIRAITSSLGLNLDPYFPTIAENPYGSFNVTEEYSGFLGKLDRYEWDLVCGSLPFYSLVSGCCDQLPSYIEDPVVWVIPNPRLVQGWKSLVLEFTPLVWSFSALSWLLIAAAFYLFIRLRKLQRRRRFVEVLIDIYGLLLGNPYPGSQDYFRRLLWLVLLYAIIITSSYKSGLVSHLTVPKYEEQLRTLEDAADRGLIALMHPVMAPAFHNTFGPGQASTSLQQLTRPGRFQFHSSLEHRLDTVVQQRNGMALASASQASMAIIRHFMTREGTPLVDTMHYGNARMHMYMAPAHRLLPIFSLKTLYLNEAGLVYYWLNDMKYTAKLKTMYGNATASTSGKKPISLGSLSGLFYLYFICASVACLSFLIETVGGKQIKNMGVTKE